jgi:SEC-C motif-containing protein
MASRFAAFAVGDSAYLLRTWHASTRPRRVDLDPAQRWLRLDIVSTSAGGPFDVTGEVEFRAFYRGGSLHERSRFVREGGEWFYVRGDVQET